MAGSPRQTLKEALQFLSGGECDINDPNFPQYINDSVYPGSFAVSRDALLNNEAVLKKAGCKSYLFDQIVQKWKATPQDNLSDHGLTYLPNSFAVLLWISNYGIGSFGTNAILEACDELDKCFEGKKNGSLTKLVDKALQQQQQQPGFLVSLFESDQKKQQRVDEVWAPVKNFLLSQTNPYQKRAAA